MIVTDTIPAKSSFIIKYYNILATFSLTEGNPYSRVERGLHTMSSYDLILRLIEMLLAEKDKNYQLRDKEMNDKD